MSNFDWERWADLHASPKAARRVLTWLEESDPDEAVWQAREALVTLVVATVNDCADHAQAREGVDLGIRNQFIKEKMGDW